MPSMAGSQGKLDAVEVYNAQPGDLTGINCPICKNKGYVARLDENGSMVLTQCKCQVQRRANRRLAECGLGAMVERCTFENYRIEKPWQRAALELAKRYAADPMEPPAPDGSGNWFYISGRSGSGKTHLCSAICSTLIRRGYDARYMIWREEAPKLKAYVGKDYPRYEALIHELENVQVLYIDDFFKGTVSDPDFNLAFELINARYNRRDRAFTIISSELDLAQIKLMDEAIGSRIYERAQAYNVATGDENWRFKRR